MVCSTKFLEVQKTDTQWCRSELFLREFCIACTSLQRLRRAHPPSPILNTFYVHICLLGSLQCHKLEICREGGDSREDQCVFTFPPIQDILQKRYLTRANKILQKPSHLQHGLFSLLTSRKRFCSIHTRTARFCSLYLSCCIQSQAGIFVVMYSVCV